MRVALGNFSCLVIPFFGMLVTIVRSLPCVYSENSHLKCNPSERFLRHFRPYIFLYTSPFACYCTVSYYVRSVFVFARLVLGFTSCIQ